MALAAGRKTVCPSVRRGAIHRFTGDADDEPTQVVATLIAASPGLGQVRI
jgi:hypothetical protein